MQILNMSTFLLNPLISQNSHCGEDGQGHRGGWCCRDSFSCQGAYMQKTCDVAEKAILPKKICGKSA